MRCNSSTRASGSSLCATITSRTSTSFAYSPPVVVDRLEHASGHDRLGLAVHEPVEGVQRLGVRRIHLERLAVALDGPRDVAEADLPQMADAVLERDGLAAGLGQLDLALEVREQVVPALRLTVAAGRATGSPAARRRRDRGCPGRSRSPCRRRRARGRRPARARRASASCRSGSSARSAFFA